ncbi:hypothetical protein HYC85_031877 [Camellia sinensis]|uniref:Uncharacterized protein n=1 Tax=Camellia sinensis TaxID=4442 RepID=A0A7J7FVN4_CAMSI|nr:hypothetical protein HYC85_031877 [Camellia sinensis]
MNAFEYLYLNLRVSTSVLCLKSKCFKRRKLGCKGHLSIATEFYKNLATGLKDIVWKSGDETKEEANDVYKEDDCRTDYLPFQFDNLMSHRVHVVREDMLQCQLIQHHLPVTLLKLMLSYYGGRIYDKNLKRCKNIVAFFKPNSGDYTPFYKVHPSILHRTWQSSLPLLGEWQNMQEANNTYSQPFSMDVMPSEFPYLANLDDSNTSDDDDDDDSENTKEQPPNKESQSQSQSSPNFDSDDNLEEPPSEEPETCPGNLEDIIKKKIKN